MSINRSTRSILLLVTSFFLAATGLRAAAPEFVLAANGESKAVIVPHGGVGTNGVNLAARELADFLGKMSGARFLVASKPVPGYRAILVGTPYRGAAKDEIRVRVRDANTLEVTGVNPRAVVYAAYDLLETLGCVFVAHDYDYVPANREPSLPGDYDKTDAPVFHADRSSWSDLGWNDLVFNLKLRQLYSESLANRRGYPDLRPEFAPGCNEAIGGRILPSKKFFEAHPEWYAYQRKSGKRDPLWPCVTNEEMYQEVFREIDEIMAKHPETREISIARGDTGALCECEQCTALVREYPDPDGSEIPYVQDVLFSNRVGRHFAKKYPNLRFNMLPYGGRYPKNEKIKFEPNVGGCSAELWRNHGLPADCNERSDYSLAQVCRLSAPGVHTYVWDYLANFRDFMIPFPNHRIFAQTARYYARIGVRGVSCQHQFCFAGDMSELKLWLYAKLLWNPDQDVEALIDTYCHAAYGNSAKFVREYLDVVEHARLRQRWTWFGCYVNDTSHYLTGEDCVRILRAMENARNHLRADPARRKLAFRASMPALSAAILRYNDMIAPAARLRYRLPSRESLWELWKDILHDSAQNFGSQMTSEAGAPWSDATIARIFANPPAASDFTCTNAAVVRVAAAQLTGGSRMTRQRDGDGTEYCQIKVAAFGEDEHIWMNPDFAEIGYTARPQDVGDWYVFATVRVGATVPVDESAAYMGIYQSWYPNGVKIGGRMEVANQAIVGRRGETEWRTVCLGKRRIFEGSRIWVMNGVLHPCDYIDVREITLVDPRLVEKTTPGDKDAKDGVSTARSIVVDAPAFDKAANVRIQDDRIDNFKYARLSNFDTNAPVESVSWTVKPEQEGDWEVLMKVRIGAAFALDYDAAMAVVTVPEELCTECGAIQTPARVHVSGSLGDEAWQIINLGRVQLKKGMKVSLAPRAGTNDVPRYVDVQSLSLLDPAFLSKSQPALPAEPAKK